MALSAWMLVVHLSGIAQIDQLEPSWVELAAREDRDARELARLAAEAERARGWNGRDRRDAARKGIRAIKQGRARERVVQTAPMATLQPGTASRDSARVPVVPAATFAQPPDDLLSSRVKRLEARRDRLHTWADVPARNEVDRELAEARRANEAWLRPAPDVWLDSSVSPALLEVQDRVAALKRERETLRTWADNDRRADVERDLKQLRAIADKSAEVMTQRIVHCVETTGGVGASTPEGGSPPLGPGFQHCAQAADSVVGTLTRQEEVRRRIQETAWTWSDVDEKRALEAELRELEGGGL
ncbi:MAG: hypothetical protein HY904_00250 [Deltaproteobacteria bacterium]|nr:hypothetical protein [Deltaproteobacteria bacterium]